MHRQMYYTSCEKGLSGYAGFQFNAVTPGTPEEALHRVEALTVYEPPESIGHAPTAAQIASCPVNLCFEPGDRPVLANVTFTGTDYSGRFGNYFAHALLGEGRFGVLPIELWDSPLWSSREAPSTDLPVLKEPLPLGPLSRARVEAFLTSSEGRRRLPALLAAVELAVTRGERSVVIYDRNADRVAHWIAAVSYLLPPSLIERMSFATYRHRPDRSHQNVIGTMPGADFEPSPGAFETFYLFDFVNGAASEVPDRPLVEELAGAGLVRSASLWRSAARLAAGTEESLDEWRPVVLAAKALTGEEPAASDAVPMLEWLEASAPRLPVPSVEQLGRALLRDGTEAGLVRLAEVAGKAGAAALREELETALAELQIRGGSGEAVPLRTPGGRRHAERLYRRHLMNDDPEELARLVRLAAGHAIRLDPAVLEERGREAVGPLLFGRPVSEEVRRLIRTDAPVRSGVLAHLAGRAFEEQVEAFAGPLEGIFAEEDLLTRPALRRTALIAAARGGGDRVATVLRLADGRVEERLLRAVWPEGWQTDEAVRLLREARSVRLPVSWLEPLATQRAQDKDITAELFRFLPLVDVDGPFSPEADRRIERMRWAVEEERRLERARDDRERGTAAVSLVRAFNEPGSPISDYLLLALPGLLLALPPQNAVTALAAATSRLRAKYTDAVGAALAEPGPAAFTTAARVYAAAWTAEHDRYPVLVEEVERCLIDALGSWRQREHKQVGKALKKYDKRILESFDAWCDTHFRRRMLPKWMFRG